MSRRWDDSILFAYEVRCLSGLRHTALDVRVWPTDECHDAGCCVLRSKPKYDAPAPVNRLMMA
jgi:hypothetical protein